MASSFALFLVITLSTSGSESIYKHVQLVGLSSSCPRAAHTDPIWKAGSRSSPLSRTTPPSSFSKANHSYLHLILGRPQRAESFPATLLLLLLWADLCLSSWPEECPPSLSFPFPLQFCQPSLYLSIFRNLSVHPSCFPHWELIIPGRNAGQKKGGREKKTVPAKQICYYWVRRIASKGWLTVPSDIVFLISKGKWPSTRLPTGKKLNDSRDCRYHELNVQIHSLDFARLPGNHLKVSIPLHLYAVVAPNRWGNGSVLRTDGTRKSTAPPPPLWELPAFLWAILICGSVEIASLVSLVGHLPKIGVLRCSKKCHCIEKSTGCN